MDTNSKVLNAGRIQPNLHMCMQGSQACEPERGDKKKALLPITWHLLAL